MFAKRLRPCSCYKNQWSKAAVIEPKKNKIKRRKIKKKNAGVRFPTCQTKLLWWSNSKKISFLFCDGRGRRRRRGLIAPSSRVYSCCMSKWRRMYNFSMETTKCTAHVAALDFVSALTMWSLFFYLIFFFFFSTCISSCFVPGVGISIFMADAPFFIWQKKS